jgi:hypothetical protein
MKKYIHYLTIAIISLLFTGCTESDDEFFATESITANNKIEVSASGNVLNVTCNFDRLLNHGSDFPLDLFLTSTSREFFFNYSIQKRNTSGNWENYIPDNITATKGDNLLGSYISGIQELDALDTTYEYDTDITLNPGQYRVAIEPRIVSIGSQDAVTVIINTTTVGAVNNTLEFTVN